MWAYIIAGLIALAALATITITVKSYLAEVKESGRVEVIAQWEDAIKKRRVMEALRSATAAKGLADDRAKAKDKVKSRTVTVEKILEKTIYRNVCLDPAGLLCVNAALGGKSSAGCKPD